MTDHEFQERYALVLRWLQRRRAYLAAAIVRLGQVRMTERVSTAAIVAQGQEVWLYFNPEFFHSLTIGELAGVLAHEALHFFLRHQQRAAVIRNERDRFYFHLACEAVVNDLILASFKEMRLPGQPVTGLWLVGQDTSGMSAEQVMHLLWRQREENPMALDGRLATGQTLDDHSLWAPQSESSDASAATSSENRDDDACSDLAPAAADWTDETTALVPELFKEVRPEDPCYGTVALGANRSATPERTCRKNLARFLNDTLSAAADYDTLWTVPNRKLLSVYPQVILPTYEIRSWHNILMAIDTSGSVPDDWLPVAYAFARQRHPQTRITLVTFDVAYTKSSPTP